MDRFAHRLHGTGPNGRPETLGQTLGQVFFLGVVDDVFGLHLIARNLIEAAQSVGQPQADGLLAIPEQTAEQFGVVLQTLASTALDRAGSVTVPALAGGAWITANPTQGNL